MKKVYLDVCCLNRPYDDQTQDRIRLESEAVLLILNHIERGELQLIGSVVVDYEIDKIPNIERRFRVKRLADITDKVIQLDESVIIRGEEIKKMGFDTYDALHISCAEKGNAEVFLSTDDRVLTTAIHHAKNLKIRIEDPLVWIQEIRANE